MTDTIPLCCAGGMNFQRVSHGLDASVAIYSKRVDHTYKQVYQNLRGVGSSGRAIAAAAVYIRHWVHSLKQRSSSMHVLDLQHYVSRIR